MSEKILELKGLTKNFGGVVALNEVNLHVNKQEILALIGPLGGTNGGPTPCGKKVAITPA